MNNIGYLLNKTNEKCYLDKPQFKVLWRSTPAAQTVTLNDDYTKYDIIYIVIGVGFQESITVEYFPECNINRAYWNLQVLGTYNARGPVIFTAPNKIKITVRENGGGWNNNSINIQAVYGIKF